jgi:rhomboid-like protein
MVPISIGYGVAGMVAFDIIGLLFRLKLFDHAAHLGGAAFGYFYYYNGSDIWEAVKARIRTYKAKYLRTE